MSSSRAGPPPTPPSQGTAQSRLLALDLGGRRTGVAISDELGMFAHPRPAIVSDGFAGLAEAVTSLVADEGITEVVVGKPVTMAGGESKQTRRAAETAAKLREALPVPVTEWDERLTTAQASRDVRGKKRRERGELDSAAAAILLQAVLDARRRPPA